MCKEKSKKEKEKEVVEVYKSRVLIIRKGKNWQEGRVECVKDRENMVKIWCENEGVKRKILERRHETEKI